VKDANSYASWGVDYLKYDNCYNENIPPKYVITCDFNLIYPLGNVIQS
jgi:hypothetical protein